MSLIGGATGDEGLIAAGLRGTWAMTDAAITTALSAVVGTYSLIKQSELQQQELDLARTAAAQNNTLLDLAQSQYANVAVPTYQKLAAVYDRYVGTFMPMEPTFLQFAFNPKTYTLDYGAVTAKVQPCVRSEFDKAKRAINRAGGKCGVQVCGAALMMSVAAAATETDALNDMYRFEEDRKRWYDEFYWRKLSTGVKFVSGLEQRAISGVNAAAHGVSQSMSQLTSAYRMADQATQRQMAVLAGMSDTWGGVANGAFQMLGAGASNMRNSWTLGQEYGHNFASEHSWTIAIPGEPVAAMY